MKNYLKEIISDRVRICQESQNKMPDTTYNLGAIDQIDVSTLTVDTSKRVALIVLDSSKKPIKLLFIKKYESQRDYVDVIDRLIQVNIEIDKLFARGGEVYFGHAENMQFVPEVDCFSVAKSAYTNDTDFEDKKTIMEIRDLYLILPAYSETGLLQLSPIVACLLCKERI